MERRITDAPLQIWTAKSSFIATSDACCESRPPVSDSVPIDSINLAVLLRILVLPALFFCNSFMKGAGSQRFPAISTIRLISIVYPMPACSAAKAKALVRSR